MQQDAVSAVIRKYFAAFLAQDRKTLEEGFSDDFTFNSPLDDILAKQLFLRGVCREAINFSPIILRSFSYKEMKLLFFIKQN